MCYLCNVDKTKELFNIMTHNELIRRLKRAGCTLVRHGTRHDIWFSPITGKTAPVPRHGRKEIPPGTLKSIEKELLGL
jgi:predicted RNA binding protein YcfA (HicA-like mRNA interferase family)